MAKAKKVAIGVVAGLAAAGVAAYLLTGEQGKKNRKAVKAWAKKMQGEISREIGKLKQVSKEQYLAIIADVAARYKNMDKEELADIVSDLKKHWAALAPAAAKPRAKAKSAAKKKK